MVMLTSQMLAAWRVRWRCASSARRGGAPSPYPCVHL